MKKQPTARRITRLMREGNYRQAAQELYGFCAAESAHKVLSPSDVIVILDEYRTCEQECFVVVTLNSGHDVIKRHVITKGLLNKTVVHPREVFRVAIQDNAAAVILCHNHPSGSPEPSPEDRDITKRIDEAGKIVGSPVLDHVIVCGNGSLKNYSFAENGLL